MGAERSRPTVRDRDVGLGSSPHHKGFLGAPRNYFRTSINNIYNNSKFIYATEYNRKQISLKYHGSLAFG